MGGKPLWEDPDNDHAQQQDCTDGNEPPVTAVPFSCQEEFAYEANLVEV
jgi:hypothetical protein